MAFLCSSNCPASTQVLVQPGLVVICFPSRGLCDLYKSAGSGYAFAVFQGSRNGMSTHLLFSLVRSDWK